MTQNDIRGAASGARRASGADNAGFMAGVWADLARMAPYDRVLTLARMSPELKARGFPGDLHDTQDLSDEGLARALEVYQPQAARTVWETPSDWLKKRADADRRSLATVPWMKPSGSGPNGELMNSDTDAWTRTVWGEGENQGDEGMRAIASTIATRSKMDGKSILDVVDEGDGSQFNARRGPRRVEMDKLDPRSPGYQRARRAVDAAIAGVDPENQFYFFYNPRLQAREGRPKPSFDNGKGVKIRDQLYFPWEAGQGKKR